MKYIFLVSYFILCCYALFWVEIKPVYNEPTCNYFENKKRANPNQKFTICGFQLSFLSMNMLVRRSCQISEATDFYPKSEFEYGIFSSNLYKSLINNRPFPIKSAVLYFDFCFDKCPQLKKSRSSYLKRYEENYFCPDSLQAIFFDITYLAGIDGNLVFNLGGLIDVIASIDTANITDETIERLLDMRLNLSEYKELCGTQENDMEGCNLIDSLFAITNEINNEDDKIEPITKDARVTSLKARSRLKVTYENKKIVNRFVAEAKRIRMEIVGF